MEKRFASSILEIIVVIFIIFVFSNMARPILDIVKEKANKTKTIAAVKNIGLVMIAYAEDDIRAFKMPYPLPRGQEKVWGNSKACWSTSVMELLFRQKYLTQKDEAQLKSPGITSSNYKSMFLDDTTVDKDKFWNKKTPLDFQIYCEKTLTSNVSGRLILIATYDNDDIRNCQFNGSGWVVFFADKSTEFVKRAKIQDFNLDATPPIISINKVEGSIAGAGIVLRKDIPVADGGPGTFGENLGGGSTELMGKRDNEPVYQALIK